MSDELAPTPEASDPPLTEADYAAISGLLMESARGRWFLAEYARRNRQADTTLVLDAIARIESLGPIQGRVTRIRLEHLHADWH